MAWRVNYVPRDQSGLHTPMLLLPILLSGGRSYKRHYIVVFD